MIAQSIRMDRGSALTNVLFVAWRVALVNVSPQVDEPASKGSGKWGESGSTLLKNSAEVGYNSLDIYRCKSEFGSRKTDGTYETNETDVGSWKPVFPTSYHIWIHWVTSWQHPANLPVRITTQNCQRPMNHRQQRRKKQFHPFWMAKNVLNAQRSRHVEFAEPSVSDQTNTKRTVRSHFYCQVSREKPPQKFQLSCDILCFQGLKARIAWLWLNRSACHITRLRGGLGRFPRQETVGIGWRANPR